tara:strand:- start:10334 stop:11068 length:735 start_codon:yes stop_codon:yes gene_type:complete
MKIKKNLKNFYDKNGYAVIKNLINQKEIERIKLSLHKHINDNLSSFKGRDIAIIKNTKEISSVHNLKKWKQVKKMQNTKKIQNLARLFLKSKVKNFGAEVFAKPAKIGLPAPIHQDNHYWHLINDKGITLWIALDNSNKKNGAVFYFNGSHKLGLLEHKLSKVTGLSQELKYKDILKYFKKTTPELKAGDALIHNCMIIHGSNSNKSKSSRIGLTMRFISSVNKFNIINKKKYDAELRKVLKNQ